MKDLRSNGMLVVFVDHITFFSLLKLLPLGRRVKTIWYFEPIASYAQICLKMLCGLGWIQAERRQIDCHIGQVRNHAGESISIKLWGHVRDICRKMRKEKLVQHRLIKSMGSLWAVDKVLLYFEKMIESEVKRECSRIHLVEWILRTRMNVNPAQSVLLIEHKEWFPYLQAHASSQGIKLISYHEVLIKIPKINLRKSAVVWKILVVLLRKIRSGIRQVVGASVSRRRSRMPASAQNHKAPTIAIQYGHRKLSFDPSERSEFFWVEGSGIPYSEVILYHYVFDKPLDAQTLEQIKMRGIKVFGKAPGIPFWVPTRLMFLILWKTLLKLGYSILICLRYRQGLSAYYLYNLFMLALAYSYWYDFFAAHRVRVNVGMLNTSVPQVLAMDALNGVTVVYQHSISNIISPTTLLSVGDNIQFVYSGAFIRLWQSIEAPVDTFVTTGYVYDSAIQTIRGLDRMAKMKRELQENGARFILCFFDEASVNRWDIPCADELATNDYEYLLKWLLADPELGIVFKPKKATTLFQRIAGVAGLIDEAKKTGRCKFLMSDTLYGSCYPAEAAIISDLCVGKLVGSTAALEARLAGVSTVLIDDEGVPDHPLYSLGSGRVIFDGWKSLRSAIDRYRSSPESFQELGDWSLALRELDPFQDGKSTLRMGQYICRVYDALKKGVAKKDVLESAAKRYAEVWGDEYITMQNYHST